MLSWDEREALTDAEPWVPDEPHPRDVFECVECGDGSALREGEECAYCGRTEEE